ncbi:MAG TPA: S8 family serine peptidase [Kofleriaceae bacterium]|nr:S8 family serine peptidase [Kofleriaceae bacterium]
MTMAKWWLVPLTVSCALAACDGGGGDGLDGDVDGDHGNGADGNSDGDAQPGTGGSPAAGGAAAPTRTVTLLTGDHVSVIAGSRYAIEPGPGRTAMRFRSWGDRDHHYVVPEDAAALVADGRVDRRLFDVAELVRIGYDDARRADLPLIVTYVKSQGSQAGRRSQRPATAAALTAAGASIARALPSIAGDAVRAPRSRTAAIWSSLAGGAPRGRATRSLAAGIDRVWLDGMREPMLDHSAPQIGAPVAWAAGLTGAGVTVAVLDTGIDASHPDFAGRIAEATSFVDTSPDAVDDVGHGTHVASILAGSGAAEGGRYRGIAPDASLMIGKVCDLFGCPESAILAGMEWAAEGGASVVNLSLGGQDDPGVDPLEEAIDTLSAEHGTLFVVAAGNLGGCGGFSLQVSSPSTADAALSVGAVDSQDLVAFFSCRGPRLGDAAVKPEITAPGVEIVAARAVGTPDGDFEPVDDFYTRLSGTSMSTPHVAGAAAILAQQHPDWSGADLKAALMASAKPTPDESAFVQGAGRVDVARGITQTAFTSPASLSLGRAPWPHDDDAPIAQTITYHNAGPDPITLALALEVTGPAGEPAPTGMFAVAPDSLTVAPGGDAQATVTAAPAVPGPDGRYSGALVASAGDAAVRTPLGLDREVESYDLDLTFRYRDDPPGISLVTLVNLDSDEIIGPLFALESTSQHLPRGRYNLDVAVFDQTTLTVADQAVIDLSRSISEEVDARAAQPVGVTVPNPAARRIVESIETEVHSANSFLDSSTLLIEPLENDILHTLDLGSTLPPDQFFASVLSVWADPGQPDNPFFDSPYAFDLTFVAARGGFFTGFNRDVGPGDLAAVRSDHAAGSPDFTGDFFSFGMPVEDPPFSSTGVTLSFRIPTTRTDYFNTDGMSWTSDFQEIAADGTIMSEQQAMAPSIYRPGGRYRAHWNQAVLGPSLKSPLPPAPWVIRDADQIRVQFVALHADAADHHGIALTTGHERLFRGGELVGESEDPLFGDFSVPPAPADYRLEVQAIRDPAARLSTQVDVAWSFRSGHVDAEAPLPVMAVRFTPPLDELNRAPAGRLFAIPVSLSRPLGAPVSPLRDMTVAASYDGGVTWQPAILIRFGDVALAVLHHPSGDGSVALRATAEDHDGNAVEQTIRDAYLLKGR